MAHRRALMGAAVLALGLIAIGPRAGAHAALASSVPPDGARLDAAPGAVTITFTEPPELSLTKVRVLDSVGEDLARGVEPLDGDRFGVRVALEDLARDAYTVAWRTVSRADGHATAGTFTFGVGVDPASAAPARPGGQEAEGPGTSGLEVASRAAFIVGLVVLLGVASAGAWTFRGPFTGALGLAGAATAVAAAGLVGLAAAQRRAAETGWVDLLGTGVGRALLWRAVALGACGAALAAGRRVGTAWPYGAAAGAAALAMLAHVATGHASAQETWTAAKVGAQWAHFAAAGIWLGGLAALVAGGRSLDGEGRGAAVRRFSSAAGVMLAVVVGAGVVRAFNELDSWNELWTSTYGRVVLVKIGLLVALAAMGAVNRYRNVPRASTDVRPLVKLSRAELAVGVLVLLAAGLLASLAPPAAPVEGRREQRGLLVTGSDFATSVRARMTVDPGTAGTNLFTLRLTDYDTGEPVEAHRVALRFDFLDDTDVAPTELELDGAGPGVYRARGGTVSLEGRWRATAVVERGADSVEVPLEFATPCRTRAVPAPDAPTVHLIELPEGATAEMYVEPAEPGVNNVHLTLTDHHDVALQAHVPPEITAARTGDDPVELEVRELGPGHYVGAGELEEGRWRFDFETHAGRSVVRGCFEATIGG